ncbi:MAG: hypothetical protein QM704_19860 [Anaeromyxobacteraceae bacterium]
MSSASSADMSEYIASEPGPKMLRARSIASRTASCAASAGTSRIS